MIKIRKTSKFRFFSKLNIKREKSLVNYEDSDKFKEIVSIIKKEIVNDLYKRFPLSGSIKKYEKTKKLLNKMLKNISYFLPLSSNELANISASNKNKRLIIYKELSKGKNSVILNQLYIDQELGKSKYDSFNFYRLTTIINNLDFDKNYKSDLIKYIKNEQHKFISGKASSSLKKYMIEYKIDNGPLLTKIIERHYYDYDEFESYIVDNAKQEYDRSCEVISIQEVLE